MPTKRAPERILLVEDHPIARQGLAELINQDKSLQVCGYAEDLREVLKEMEVCAPSLVLLDISLKGCNGLEVLKHLKTSWPAVKVLALSMHDESVYALRAIRAGAAGYIMKHEATHRILEAIKVVLAGELYLGDSVKRRAMHQLLKTGQPAASPVEMLTDRELEVFSLLGAGKATRQIAGELHLSMKTVESHRAHIKEKLGVSSGTELVQHAVQWCNAEMGL